MSDTDNGAVPSPDRDHKKSREEEYDEKRRETIASLENGIALNASGHRDQLKRHFNILHLCGLALTIDNAWIALGGSITISIRMLSSGRAESISANLCNSQWRSARNFV
jgi:hypothetical protein